MKIFAVVSRPEEEKLVANLTELITEGGGGVIPVGIGPNVEAFIRDPNKKFDAIICTSFNIPEGPWRDVFELALTYRGMGVTLFSGYFYTPEEIEDLKSKGVNVFSKNDFLDNESERNRFLEEHFPKGPSKERL